jgi:hypothetical protein
MSVSNMANSGGRQRLPDGSVCVLFSGRRRSCCTGKRHCHSSSGSHALCIKSDEQDKVISLSSLISGETSANTCVAPSWPRMFDFAWDWTACQHGVACVSTARLSGSGSELDRGRRPSVCHRLRVAQAQKQCLDAMNLVSRAGIFDAPGTIWPCIAEPAQLIAGLCVLWGVANGACQVWSRRKLSCFRSGQPISVLTLRLAASWCCCCTSTMVGERLLRFVHACVPPCGAPLPAPRASALFHAFVVALDLHLSRMLFFVQSPEAPIVHQGPAAIARYGSTSATAVPI